MSQEDFAKDPVRNRILFAKLAGLREGSPLTFATGERSVQLARMLFAVSLIPIGL